MASWDRNPGNTPPYCSAMYCIGGEEVLDDTSACASCGYPRLSSPSDTAAVPPQRAGGRPDSGKDDERTTAKEKCASQKEAPSNITSRILGDRHSKCNQQGCTAGARVFHRFGGENDALRPKFRPKVL